MIKVYSANRPPLAEYLEIDVIDQLPAGEINRIATETGNHWRKIFNVYAKLVYRLAEMTQHGLLQDFSRWQHYRDHSLLQRGSDTELHLDSACLDALPLESFSANSALLPRVNIVMGKTFSERLLADVPLEWLDKDFAIHRQQNIIVCPYFDYRQLSNVKIERLAELIISLQSIQGSQSIHPIEALI